MPPTVFGTCVGTAVGGACGEPAQSVGNTDEVCGEPVVMPEVTLPVVVIEPKHGGLAAVLDGCGCVDGGGGGVASEVCGADSVEAGVDTVGEVTFVGPGAPDCTGVDDGVVESVVGGGDVVGSGVGPIGGVATVGGAVT